MSAPDPGDGGRRVGLQVKVVAVLLVIALTPLLVGTFLVDKIAEVAQNFASNEAEKLRAPLAEARQVYTQLIETKKRMYRHMVDQLAESTAVREALAGGGTDRFRVEARRLLDAEPDLLGVSLRGPGGAIVAEENRPTPTSDRQVRRFTAGRELAGGQIDLAFGADVDALLKQVEDMGKVLGESRVIDQTRRSLPASYRLGFVALVGGVVVLVTATGILLSRRLTGRIAVLLSGTRRVAGGDLEARVTLHGRDELGELATAFNRMVEDLKRDRQQILYLQRIGAWQDVARRLAHEIKNPLTPIQLAVQELVSSYAGDDPRHRKMLDDVAEIVGEEIRSLRRLVDAFSALGRLPPVEPRPLAMTQLADDLGKDPLFSAHLELVAPREPVTVSGDRLLLRRLLANLIENAVHAGEAAGKSGRVVMRWSADRDRALVTIDDEGRGVTEADRERIFEPYVTSKETGTGLGLAIAKKIALDHGGNVVADLERAPTGGARFVLTLPLA